LGIGDWAQSPIPNPQSPIPNPQSQIEVFKKLKIYKKIINIKNDYYYFIVNSYFIQELISKFIYEMKYSWLYHI